MPDFTGTTQITRDGLRCRVSVQTAEGEDRSIEFETEQIPDLIAALAHRANEAQKIRGSEDHHYFSLEAFALHVSSDNRAVMFAMRIRGGVELEFLADVASVRSHFRRVMEQLEQEPPTSGPESSIH